MEESCARILLEGVVSEGVARKVAIWKLDNKLVSVDPEAEFAGEVSERESNAAYR